MHQKRGRRHNVSLPPCSFGFPFVRLHPFLRRCLRKDRHPFRFESAIVRDVRHRIVEIGTTLDELSIVAPLDAGRIFVGSEFRARIQETFLDIFLSRRHFDKVAVLGFPRAARFVDDDFHRAGGSCGWLPQARTHVGVSGDVASFIAEETKTANDLPCENGD